MDIEAHYIKNSDFKTLPISGAYGGVLGNGQLNLNLFVERGPIPRNITFNVNLDGSATEKSRDSKSGVVREVSVGLVMDLNTTRALHKLLQDMIGEQERILSQNLNLNK